MGALIVAFSELTIADVPFYVGLAVRATPGGGSRPLPAVWSPICRAMGLTMPKAPGIMPGAPCGEYLQNEVRHYTTRLVGPEAPAALLAELQRMRCMPAASWTHHAAMGSHAEIMGTIGMPTKPGICIAVSSRSQVLMCASQGMCASCMQRSA